jgi:hypothetical protein
VNACLICHQEFKAGERTVGVDLVFSDGGDPQPEGAVHLWHLSALPSLGGGK